MITTEAVMKKIVLIIVCIFCVSVLASCTQNKQEEAASVASETVRLFNESELLKALEAAEKEYEWIRGLEVPPYHPSGKRVSVNEVDYEELNIEGVSSKSDLKKYLQKHFSEEISEKLVNQNNAYELFKDIEGKLYCIGGYAGLRFFSFTERSVVIKEQSDKKVIFTLHMTAVNADASNEYKTQHDYTYEKQSDSHWVFTDFELPYDVTSRIFSVDE